MTRSAPIPFPVTSAPGRNVFDSAGRLINCYAEPLVAGARGENVRRRSPGLVSFKLASFTGWRGGIVVGGNLLYAAFSASGGKVATYTTGGVETIATGNLTGTKKVFWARNDKATPDVVAVDPDNGAFQITAAPAVIAYPDGDVGSPNSVCFLDGYFFFTSGDGTCRASAINDTAIDPLDFVKVDGNVGGLLRAIPWSQLYLCGTDTIEVYADTAEPVGFPFSRVTIIPRGLLGRYAITGYEPDFGRGIIFVGNDRKVYTLNGYAPTEISTPDVCRAVADFIDDGGSVDDIEMWPYSVAGHAAVVLQLGTAATWVFDVDRLWWHERTSPSSMFIYWRAHGGVSFNNKWLAGDSASANIVEISETVQDELGNNIPIIVETGPVTAFPNRLAVAQATFDVARGVGMATGSDPQQTDPRCYIQWSDDGGLSWSTPLERKLGRQKTSPGPVRVNRAGITKDEGRRWRVTVYDPVDVELIGGAQSDSLRNY
jgi:hypothetical protein